VLVEEELVAIDLDSDKWPTYQLPYVNSLHSSAITCSQHVSNVPEQLWTKITDVGQSQMAAYSKRVRFYLHIYT
jgi:lethal(2) giant larvae protein